MNWEDAKEAKEIGRLWTVGAVIFTMAVIGAVIQNHDEASDLLLGQLFGEGFGLMGYAYLRAWKKTIQKMVTVNKG